eukprot:CAMPEP_0177529406 /NCGR_PEP_ID=MMETSP0369-20130122/52785_1 /TAXON_ID=447022 ORGANISM="Scrippsiella hangoei-like, Strain SHHI-4" /NCGR_SAMPLE_ID=MMETSP0369 /ASSEMBLY_ACC=CAM_ASM_000364 /LENGTH=70 /DNA_ID=CAMNT_0019010065 /DNA_START=36 /DNA_END=244 /DNA_ORIENTATION=+
MLYAETVDFQNSSRSGCKASARERHGACPKVASGWPNDQEIGPQPLCKTGCCPKAGNHNCDKLAKGQNST